MTLTHVVLLKWRPGTKPEDVQPGINALAAIPLSQHFIQSYRLGEDLEIGQTHTNHDLAIVAEFANEADYHRYATSDEHLSAVGLLKPYMAVRNAVQARLSERAKPQRSFETHPQALFAFAAGVALTLWLRPRK
mmetsp:Transcript_19265/g.59302  ORF Transcript_19265/g.59302 Transcript_19265/m.59302 type:complete len:134 (-) Transcript_19265:18-419(-)